MTFNGRELRSTIASRGTLTLSLEQVAIGEPADDEVIVLIEAAPINPSDLVWGLGPADRSTLQASVDGKPGLIFSVPDVNMTAPTGRPDQSAAGRLNQSLPVGFEGAGTVVAAGKDAQALKGKRVAMLGVGMFADYHKIRAQDVTPLPPNATAAQGAAMFINPLSALGFLETARRGGHQAIIHTAAASSLGQMLQRLCLADGIALINIVRSQEQVDLLRQIGATIVLNSKDKDFHERLIVSIEETGATVAFDPIGGGSFGSDLLVAMEEAILRRTAQDSRFSVDPLKQLYIYGFLDTGPTILSPGHIGDDWSVAGWRLPPFLKRAGAGVEQRLRQRVIDELTTTFATRYTKVIGLAEALQPDVLRAYDRKATGEKFLIDPRRG